MRPLWQGRSEGETQLGTRASPNELMPLVLPGRCTSTGAGRWFSLSKRIEAKFMVISVLMDTEDFVLI
jgi:hypothetical protein